MIPLNSLGAYLIITKPRGVFAIASLQHRDLAARLTVVEGRGKCWIYASKQGGGITNRYQIFMSRASRLEFLYLNPPMLYRYCMHSYSSSPRIPVLLSSLSKLRSGSACTA
jgi:hypothetical protein